MGSGVDQADVMAAPESRRSVPEPPRRGYGTRMMDWWYAHTSPLDVAPTATFAEREWARRGRLASTLMLCFIVLGLLAMPFEWGHGEGSFNAAVIVVVAVVGLVLNRRGHSLLVGVLMVAVIDLGTASAVVILPSGKLDVVWAFVATVVIAASLLPPVSVFVVAVVNSLFTLVYVILLAPNTQEIREVLVGHDFAAVAEPLLVQAFVGVMAYLWVRNALDAIERADRAEEIAELRRSEAERKLAMEEGAAQIQAVLVQLANGHYRVRVPALRDPLLWQVGNSLNMFIGRLSRLTQADFTLQREHEEAERLAAAIYALQAGHPVIWPAPSGLPLDSVTNALRGLTSGESTAKPAPAQTTPPQTTPPQSPRPATHPLPFVLPGAMSAPARVDGPAVT